MLLPKVLDQNLPQPTIQLVSADLPFKAKSSYLNRGASVLALGIDRRKRYNGSVEGGCSGIVNNVALWLVGEGSSHGVVTLKK